MNAMPDADVSPPISHSVLNASYLAQEVQRRYALKGRVRAQLLYRGMNDVYIISDDAHRYALRVWRAANFRPIEEDVQFELNYLQFLKSRGFPVSASIAARDGSHFFTYMAPEGLRPIALYDWAPGAKFGEMLDVPTAERIGALFAQMHLLAREFPGKVPPVALGGASSLVRNVPHVIEFVFDRADDMRDYPIIARGLAERMEEVKQQDLPRGICHRDFHPSNVHVSRDGIITFLDFDGCAEDFLMQDVKNYVWGNDFYAYPASYGDAFERGYQQVRPFTADERRNGELFLLNKAYSLISGLSMAANAVGRSTLRFRNLDWFGTTIRARARALGIL